MLCTETAKVNWFYMKRHTITHQRASKHFFNICAKCFNISLYIIRLSLSYIFYLINLFFSLRSMLAFTDYSMCIKKAICVISRLKRFCTQKNNYVFYAHQGFTLCLIIGLHHINAGIVIKIQLFLRTIIMHIHVAIVL